MDWWMDDYVRRDGWMMDTSTHEWIVKGIVWLKDERSEGWWKNGLIYEGDNN